ncbi:hypothetical protein [Clostridium sporogenes]|uniref:hypothetical protein n=1 Tax=Clostridium sporogenes TaxID=1509 RepID=UPI0013CFB3BE|nr:hypothetical protein [Clostridium sporogenes]MCW6124219.1 hypothetical protein [Clostridium sporogenes]NFH40110.1 hypothetical protein [Clostridium sporogenes]NFH49394.1 hypothetical protein [Clostridium sporogenes]NFQ85429.1 hypothetical protein [Clostridium sporogenes]
MENTEFRLNESKFFLEGMKENKEKSPEFEYYLNAYISSARSVLWIMKNEYCKLKEWKKWYDDKDVNQEQKKLLEGIVKMRNRSLKQRPLKVKEYITIGDDKNFCDIGEVFKKFIGKRVNVEIKQIEDLKKFNISEDRNYTEVIGKLRISTTVEEFKNKDIINICTEYDTWLSNIVNECINIFG